MLMVFAVLIMVVISMMLVMMASVSSDANHDGVVDNDGGDVVDDLHLQDLVCTEP